MFFYATGNFVYFYLNSLSIFYNFYKLLSDEAHRGGNVIMNIVVSLFLS